MIGSPRDPKGEGWSGTSQYVSGPSNKEGGFEGWLGSQLHCWCLNEYDAICNLARRLNWMSTEEKARREEIWWWPVGRVYAKIMFHMALLLKFLILFSLAFCIPTLQAQNTWLCFPMLSSLSQHYIFKGCSSISECCGMTLKQSCERRIRSSLRTFFFILIHLQLLCTFVPRVNNSTNNEDISTWIPYIFLGRMDWKWKLVH